jgi:hypothetical protein
MRKLLKRVGLLLLLLFVVVVLTLLLKDINFMSLDSRPIDKKKMPLLYNQLKEEVAGKGKKVICLMKSVYVVSIKQGVQDLAKEAINNYYSHYDQGEAADARSTLEMLIIDAENYSIVAYTGNPNKEADDFWSDKARKLAQCYSTGSLIVGVNNNVRLSSETCHVECKVRFDDIMASGREKFESSANSDIYFLLSQDYLTIIILSYSDDDYRIGKRELNYRLYRPFRDSLRISEVLEEHLIKLTEGDTTRFIYPIASELFEIEEQMRDTITGELITITKSWYKTALDGRFVQGIPESIGKTSMYYNNGIDYHFTGKWYHWNERGLLAEVRWYDENGKLQNIFRLF